MAKIAVLGTGRIGRFIAEKLQSDHQIIAADQDPGALQSMNCKTVSGDLTRSAFVEEICKPADLVINALPGSIGFETLSHVLRAQKPVVDISFSDKDPRQLDKLARNSGVTAIVDAGIAPGLSNLVAGFWHHRLGLKSFNCYVGGLPLRRTLPWEYKAPFSPADVLEEYTRPARIKEKGQILEKPALSDPQRIETDVLGTLEAFNTDGLRTLLSTLSIPNMREQTLRYPGHREKIKLLRTSGFLDQKPMDLGGHQVIPKDMTRRLLQKQWKMKPEDRDCTYMRIDMERSKVHRLELFDQFDTENNDTSMARCTGFSCMAFVRLLLENRLKKEGVWTPEEIGASEDHYNFIINYLRDQEIQISEPAMNNE